MKINPLCSFLTHMAQGKLPSLIYDWPKGSGIVAKMDIRNARLFRRKKLAVGAASGRASYVGCKSIVSKDTLAIALVEENGQPRWCHPPCFADALRRQRQPRWIVGNIPQSLDVSAQKVYGYQNLSPLDKITVKRVFAQCLKNIGADQN
jgi:hypothetical protein